MDSQINPFAVLSLIVAPAILTNACTVLAMSTSNRLARASDRARELSRQLEAPDAAKSPESARRLRELKVAEERSLLLLRALRGIYLAVGSFAFATLASLVGAVAAGVDVGLVLRLLELVGAVAGAIAVSALIFSSTILVHETRLVVRMMHERAESVRALGSKDLAG
jgi:hypothetical protein